MGFDPSEGLQANRQSYRLVCIKCVCYYLKLVLQGGRQVAVLFIYLFILRRFICGLLHKINVKVNVKSVDIIIFDDY